MTTEARNMGASEGNDRADDRVSRMYEIYSRGASLSEVGRLFGLTGARVKQLFTQARLEVRGYEAAIRLYNDALVTSSSAFPPAADGAECLASGGGPDKSPPDDFASPSARTQAMLDLRRQGFTLREIGRRHGITEWRVSQILSPVDETVRDDLQRHAPQRPRVDVDEIVMLRLQGLTLNDIGRRIGLTRERVRQILDRAGVSAEQVAAAKEGARLAAARPHHSPILTMYREGREVREIAALTGLPSGHVTVALRELVTPGDRAARRESRAATRGGVSVRYSDAELLTAIRRAAEELGDVPSSNSYSRVREDLGLPSVPTIANRFGGWAAAVRAAGMVPHRGNREYSRRWSADACWRTLRALAKELGRPPTVQQYELLAASNDDLPSLATVRNRLGRWSSVVARLHGDGDHPILARIGVEDDHDPGTRQEAIWLAYLAEELSEEELARLIREELFIWDDSYGEPPSNLRLE